MIEKEKEGRERYNSSKEMRKQVLGETMNCSSHKMDECANEITLDVPKTEECADKKESLSSLCECFYEVNTHRTELKS